MPTPRCADRLDLVDAAYERPGSAAGEELKALCGTCPMWRDCLHRAMVKGEAGVWGGTGPKTRTAHGAQPWMKTATI